MSTVSVIAADLATQLPPKIFDVRDVEDLPDKPSRAVLTVALVDYEPAANYQGSIQANLRLTLISRLQDKAKALAELDELIFDVTAAFVTTGLVWRRATPKIVKEIYYGLEITADTIITIKPREA